MHKFAFPLVLLAASCLSGNPLHAQEVPAPEDYEALLERLEAAEERIRLLEAEPTPPEAVFDEPPGVVVPPPAEPEDEGSPIPEEPVEETDMARFDAGYDEGFFIRPRDEDEFPFELKITGRMQFRYTALDRDRPFFVDPLGDVIPVTQENYFEIERGRLTFEGFFLDPQLQYYLNIDGDTDDEHVAVFHDFWINYVFSEAFDLHVGKAFVPGSREWLMGSTRTRFADRSLATTFFRPDRSVGVWAEGEITEDLFYRAMVANGYAVSDLEPEELDHQFTYSASSWWHPFEEFGQGFSDLEWHECLAVQLGHSFTASPTTGEEFDRGPLAEQNFVRLANGLRLTELGALAPGVVVDQFDVYLYAMDAALKYRGFSLNGEYYFRWLENIAGNAPLPISDVFQHGFYLEAGYFVVPRLIELNARTSQINGEYGYSAEYAAGVNWFINGTHNLKLTADVTELIDVPISNSGPNYRLGDDGLMFRVQFQAAF